MSTISSEIPATRPIDGARRSAAASYERVDHAAAGRRTGARDLHTALRFARGTASGLVHVDRETAGVEPHLPFGGLEGSSSMQREQGLAARDFFTNVKTVDVRPR